MKKIIIVFISFLFVFIISLKEVEASQNNYDYLPLGVNYLDPSNISYEDLGNYTYTFTSNNPFKIEETKVYSLFATNYPIENFISYDFTFYDASGSVVNNQVVNEVKDENNKIIALNFNARNAAKVSLSVTVKNDLSIPIDFKDSGVDIYFVFCKGLEYPGSMYEPFPYEGPRIDLEPVISGYTGLYITDVDNPITVSGIKAGLKAYDDTDGDVTDLIVVQEDTYSENCTTLGEYYIVFRAYDNSNNYTDLKIFVQVIDTLAPVISGSLNISAVASTKLSLDTITNGLILSDNYDSSSNIYLELISDNYSANYNLVGSYQIEYRATDTSGNTSTKIVTVTVSDDIAPVITGPIEHTKSNALDVNVLEFVNTYTASDDTDGNITNKIQIVKDNYTINQYNTGVWQVVLSVTDTANNTTTITINIEVIDKIGPVFFIDKTKIVIDLSNNSVTTLSLISTLQKSNIIKEDVAIEVIEDTYTENKDKPGTYKVVLGYLDQQLEIEVEVMEQLPKIEEIEDVGFLQKIANFFNRIWQALIKIFRFLFY